MQGKHTPGPWKFRPVTAQNGGPFTALLLESQAPNPPANDPCVMAVREDWVGYLIRSEKGRANAALIAAAPCMEAALREIAEYPPVGMDASEDLCNVQNIARAALAKAQARTGGGERGEG